jgi:hypothetical protein
MASETITNISSVFHRSHLPFWAIYSVLITAYGLWFFAFCPGVLGEDSLAILLEIQSHGTFSSGKPSAWYYFVNALFTPFQLVEIPIAFQLLASATVFARILAWIWQQGLRKTLAFLLIFVCLAPQTPYFIGALYPDGFYAAAVVGLTFELWQTSVSRKLSRASMAILFFTIPAAAFLRPNGILFLGPVFAVLFIVDRTSRRNLGLLTFGWCALALVGAQVHKTQKHGFMYPLAIFETANFMQPHPFVVWKETPRVSEKTIATLAKYRPIKLITDNYDRDYWDPLIYKPGGPDLSGIPQEAKDVIVGEFFRYNLWRNFPAFVASRFNVFLVSSLAQGGVSGGMEYSEIVLTKVETHSVFHRFDLKNLEASLRVLHSFSESHRWLLWSPALGFVLLFRLFWIACRTRQIPLLIVTVPLVAQLAAIFAFSIAGEYRYLFPFFLAPLVLLPILFQQKAHQPA